MTRAAIPYITATTLILFACSGDEYVGDYSLDTAAMIKMIEEDSSNEAGKAAGDVVRAFAESMEWNISLKPGGEMEMFFSMRGQGEKVTKGTWQQSLSGIQIDYQAVSQDCALEAEVLTCTSGQNTSVFTKNTKNTKNK